MDKECRKSSVTSKLIIEELSKVKMMDINILRNKVFYRDWISHFDFCDCFNALCEEGIVEINPDTLIANILI